MVMASVREELAKNGLMILQGMGVEPAMNAIGLVTRVVHVASGQWVETFSEIDRKCSAQEQGAEQTLFRRYEIVNLFAIVPEHKAKTTHAQPKVNTVNGRTPVQSNARAPIQQRGAFDDFQGGPPVGRFR